MHSNDISADRNALRALLEDTRTIAIVGLSPRPERASNEVARYLRAAGYTIIPVNPAMVASCMLSENSLDCSSAASRAT